MDRAKEERTQSVGCAGCAAWAAVSLPSWGECRRRAPGTTPGGRGEWPQTLATQRCWEWIDAGGGR